jgi:hypothetical protein
LCVVAVAVAVGVNNCVCGGGGVGVWRCGGLGVRVLLPPAPRARCGRPLRGARGGWVPQFWDPIERPNGNISVMSEGIAEVRVWMAAGGWFREWTHAHHLG